MAHVRAALRLELAVPVIVKTKPRRFDADSLIGPPLAHIPRRLGSYVALCGYRGTRHASVEEGERAGVCVVCREMNGGAR